MVSSPGALIVPTKRQRLFAQAAALLRPSPILTPDAWGADNRTYPPTAGIPGPRDPGLTPYMIPFARAVASGENRRVVLVCGSQMGKSDTILDLIGHRLDQAPAPILYVGPTQQFITDQWEPRIMGLLDEAPSIRAKVARGKRMKKTRKVISGVPLRLAHAGSSTALKSDPAALALTDEADELMANVRGQGNPIGLVDRRGDTYADFVHAIVSTPSEGRAEIMRDPDTGLEFWKEGDAEDVASTVWRFWQQGTRYHWAWRCPDCRDWFVPRFKCLVIPQGSPAEARAGTRLACPNCGSLIGDEHKAEMNARGVYVAEGQRIDEHGNVSGDPPDSETISFWVSGLCSPFRSFGDRAAEYVEALRSGDPSQEQTVINGGFGEMWAPTNGDVPEWQAVAQLRQPYAARHVPEGAMQLTAGVDVQKNRLVYTIRGWGARATSWLVDHGELWGPTDEQEVWTSLANVLQDSYSGMRIRLAFVDAGFRPNKRDGGSEHRVYAFCRLFPRLVFPTKGYATQAAPIMSSKIEVTAHGKRYGLELFRLDTDHWKSWVHTRLIWPGDQPGAFFLHETATDDYCQQLVSEARIKTPAGKPQWIMRSRNNHYLDCEALNAAAGYRLNVQKIPEGVTRTWDPADFERPPQEERSPLPPAAIAAPTSLRDRFASKASRVNR